jgi:CBS-domain-containing membrane protein
MTYMSITKEARHAKKQVLQQLTALRDEAKLQLHLLSLDARKRWNELESEINELEERASRDGEKAAETLKEAAHGLVRTLNEFMASQANQASGLSTSVRSVMTTPVRACQPDDFLTRAAQLMWESNCGAIPVISNERVVAMVTDRDICMATYTQGKAPEALRVASAMSKELFSCAPDDSVGTALATMANMRVRRLPIVDAEGKLVGVITLADVARWARPLTNPVVDAALTDTLAAISALSPQKLDAAAE